MMISLAIKSLMSRRYSALLTLVAIALSTALLLGVQQIREQGKAAFFNSVSGTDLIVGAPSGPIQLLLYSVFHIGQATNNLPWSRYQAITEDPRIEWTIPISLGDSHRGYPVVGTTADLFQHFQYGQKKSLEVSIGTPFEDRFDVVIGHDVAKRLNYQIGDALIIAHGAGNTSFMQHDNMPFTLRGVLSPTGTPLDRAVLIPLEGLEAIHLGWRAGVPIPGLEVTPEKARNMTLTPREVTSVLVGLKSKLQTFRVQRDFNNQREAPMTAVLPGMALQQLWQIIGVIEKSLLLVTAAAIVIGMTGLLALLLVGIEQRRHEIAVLRGMGCPPAQIAGLLLLESMLLTLAGLILGITLLQGLILGLRAPLLDIFGIYLTLAPPSPAQWLQAALILGMGVLAGLAPALKAWRQARAHDLIRHN